MNRRNLLSVGCFHSRESSSPSRIELAVILEDFEGQTHRQFKVGLPGEQSQGGKIMGSSRCRSEAAQRNVLVPQAEVEQARWGT